MKKQPNKRFQITDEKVNNYGFRILTSGIDTSAFLRNPVGLWNHTRSWNDSDDAILPICRWEDLKTEGTTITAMPLFDLDDEFAAKVANKVENGFLNACSVGVRILETSEDPALMLPGQKYPTVIKCQLKEISIVDIPGNYGSVVLYDADGNTVNLGDERNIELAFGKSQPSLTGNMKELETLALQLGLPATATMADIQAAITKLVDAKTQQVALSDRVKGLEVQLADFHKKEAETRKEETKTLLDAAVIENRITAAQRQAYEKLFDADYDSAKAVLEGLPKSKKLSDVPAPQASSGGGKMNYNGKTFSQLSKEEPDTLASLRENDMETFKALYKSEFGKEYRVTEN